MKYFLLFSIFVSHLASASIFSERIDKSESAFFPPEVSQKLNQYKSFPSFWWNFVVFESSKSGSELEFAKELCSHLKSLNDLNQVECQQTIASYQPHLKDWVRDLPYRLPPPNDFNKQILTTLGQLSLPIPKELFVLLRLDPMRSFEELQSLTVKKIQMNFEHTSGFLVDKSTNRFVIPIHPSFDPSESDKLRPLYEILPSLCSKSQACLKIALIGPHGSALENKLRISLDMASVSFVGILVFLFSVISLIILKRTRVALLFLPIGIATVLSALLTIFYFGSIHGLTLSFGVGIIGLTIDYGLHAAFNSYSKSLWRSNTIGFLTTLACLGIIFFSELPLLKQLIFFSICGFSLAYLILHFSRTWFIDRITVAPFHIKFSSGPKRFGVVLLCIAGLFLGVLSIRPSFDLRQFDYQRNEQKVLGDWFYQKHFKVSPLFEIETAPNPDLDSAHERKEWAEKHNIQIETVSNYLPKTQVLAANLSDWKSLQCGAHSLEQQLPEKQRKLFQPFLDLIECKQLTHSFNLESSHQYLNHLHSKNSWLTLWLPKNSTETELIQSNFPKTYSLSEIVSLFPKLLMKELRWMFLLSFFLVFTLLYGYYRSVKYVLLSLLPFICGLGLIFWFLLLFNQALSFMSLIAIVMILGLSVDYSIIAIDAYFCREGLEGIYGRSTGLVFAAVSTLLGFIPLVFCKHPVLFQLGTSLSLGILGTLVGTFWGIPQLMSLLKLEKHAA